jgi:hypothetical protein
MRLIPEAVRAGELQRLLFELHWLRHVLSLYEHRARVGDQNFLTVDFVDGARAETNGAYTRESIDQATIQENTQLLEGLRKQSPEVYGSSGRKTRRSSVEVPWCW